MTDLDESRVIDERIHARATAFLAKAERESARERALAEGGIYEGGTYAEQAYRAIGAVQAVYTRAEQIATMRRDRGRTTATKTQTAILRELYNALTDVYNLLAENGGLVDDE